MSGVTAQVVATDRYGKPTGAPVPLVLSRIRDGNAMEVRLPTAPVPNESAPVFFALRVKLKPSDKDWLTDHTFASYSKEPVSRTATPVANSAPVPPGPPAALDPLPETKQDLLAELRKNMESVTKEWQDGNLGAIWYPALRVKDVALKLQREHANDIADSSQAQFAGAVQAGHAVRVAD